MIKSETSDMLAQAGRAAPAAAGVVASAVTLSEWVAVLTGLYVIVQLIYLLWKWRWEGKERQADFDRKIREELRLIDAAHAAEARETMRKAEELCRVVESTGTYG